MLYINPHHYISHKTGVIKITLHVFYKPSIFSFNVLQKESKKGLVRLTPTNTVFRIIPKGQAGF
jgi:hypothetical protein